MTFCAVASTVDSSLCLVDFGLGCEAIVFVVESWSVIELMSSCHVAVLFALHWCRCVWHTCNGSILGFANIHLGICEQMARCQDSSAMHICNVDPLSEQSHAEDFLANGIALLAQGKELGNKVNNRFEISLSTIGCDKCIQIFEFEFLCTIVCMFFQKSQPCRETIHGVFLFNDVGIFKVSGCTLQKSKRTFQVFV